MDFKTQMRNIRKGVNNGVFGVLKPSERSADNAEKLDALIEGMGLRWPCEVGVRPATDNLVCWRYNFGDSMVGIEARHYSVVWWWTESDGSLIDECEEDCDFSSLPIGLEDVVKKLVDNIGQKEPMEQEGETDDAVDIDGTEQKPTTSEETQQKLSLDCNSCSLSAEYRDVNEEYERLGLKRKRILNSFIHRCYQGNVDMFYKSYIKITGVADDEYFYVFTIKIIEKGEDCCHRPKRIVEYGYEAIHNITDDIAWKEMSEEDFDKLLSSDIANMANHCGQLDSAARGALGNLFIRLSARIPLMRYDGGWWIIIINYTDNQNTNA